MRISKSEVGEGKCGIAQYICVINSPLHALCACSAMTPYFFNFYNYTLTVFKNTCNLLLWLSDLYMETKVVTKRKFP